MKWTILFVIRLYWLIPKRYKRSCLFKVSCSNFVYKSAQERGFLCGISAYLTRKKQFRPGYQIIISKSIGNQIKLVDGCFISENEVSSKVRKEIAAYKKNFKNNS